MSINIEIGRQMKKRIGLCVTSALLLAFTLHANAGADDIPPGYSDFGFAERCDDESAKLTTLEDIACSSTSLRAQETKMLNLVDDVRAETKGVDVETGKALDPMGAQQKKWRDALVRTCKDAVCLSVAYAARIAAIHKEWSEAL
ncbi:hypothetical protein [Pseudomonas capsici]|uniref:Lysozyme inhibitor LprI N-terminal domain-containing protein n=1 Tax=Pseudomonas capsici TaxID=2810614 RepID=A0ABT3BQK7_9PSED|nr:hypothetical protein [Pseudomonas capsici]MBN6712463.1 hypothetical protein [Pseudomonas capsici]MBN6717800.1 hypothetical protein [Pseudomonas capsici]MBN6723149.1 hypothetical protein [Pseudomonas capsici]MCV4262581.1 hypothetical protein [Pseudomonas capsici]MCV4267189.1 hypothetical protein [Pseudomonas capsici]